MIPAPERSGRGAKLLRLGATGKLLHLKRTDLARLLRPGDLVIANDAATLPASLSGRHAATGAPVELRLAAWVDPLPSQATWEEPAGFGDPTRFIAVAFGAGDWRTRTEDRPPPPRLEPGDMLALGPLLAIVEEIVFAPRLIRVRFAGTRESVWEGIARHGRPIQYAHVREPLALWDVWTRIAGLPVAFEPPSAGFALDWKTLAAFRARGIGFATLTLAAGLSSTGDPALDEKLPLDEHFRIPAMTVDAIAQSKAAGGRIIAVGTTVVRALEAAATAGGKVRTGAGIARGRIGPQTKLRLVDAILTGVHQPGESHYELLRAFADDAALKAAAAAASERGYRNHEFGDFLLVERRAERPAHWVQAGCGRGHAKARRDAAMAI